MSHPSVKTKTSHYLDGSTAFVRGRKSHKQRDLNVLKRAGITKAAIEQVLMDNKPEKAIHWYSYDGSADNDPHLRLVRQSSSSTLVAPLNCPLHVTSTLGYGIPWLCIPISDYILPQTAVGAELKTCRLGASVELGEFSMRGRITAGTEDTSPQNVRIMLIEWRGREPHLGSGAFGCPTIGSMFELPEPDSDTPSASVQASIPFSYLSTYDGTQANSGSFGQTRVLFDHTVTVSKVAASNADKPEAWFDIKHKIDHAPRDRSKR